MAQPMLVSDEGGVGRVFDGIGGLSGGGATSRLLFSYAEDTVSDILDYLFKPSFGAALQILKVEIGGDAQTTDGTESSHAHTLAELEAGGNFQRGYEWRLIQEAKKRNPNIKLYALPWAFPGFVGEGTQNPYTNRSLLVDYITAYIKGAKSTYGFDFDYVGDWNERNYDVSYLIMLRNRLDSEGFTNTKIVAPDSSWSIAGDILKNQTLAESVYAIGAHYPGTHTDSDALATGKPLWASEDYSTDNTNAAGAGCWARILNQNQLGGQGGDGNMTATISWNLIAAYYDALPYSNCGLMTAMEPWGGYYTVPGTIWVTAHTTQFTDAGWTYLQKGKGVSALPKGGSMVTFVSDLDLTIVVEKMSDKSKCIRPGLPSYSVEEETLSFQLGGSLLGKYSGKALHVYMSIIPMDGQSNATYFAQQKDIQVDSKGAFSLDVPVDALFTISTRTGTKGQAAQPSPPAAFPLPYADDFDSCPDYQEADFFADQAGVWECRSGVMTQQAPEPPVRWGGDILPLSVMGDSAWDNVKINVDARVEQGSQSNATIVVGVRARGGTTNMGAFWLEIALGDQEWNVYFDVASRAARKSHYNGKLPVSVHIGDWHHIELVANGSQASASLDQKPLFSNVDMTGAPGNGFAAIGSSFDYVSFNNFQVNSSIPPPPPCATPTVNQTVTLQPCSSANQPTQEYTFVDSQLQLASNSKLCLGINGKDPSSGFPNVAVVDCAHASRWTYSQGLDTFRETATGYCLDVTGQNTSPNSNVELYTCNDGTNQMWTFSQPGPATIVGVASSLCASACSN